MVLSRFSRVQPRGSAPDAREFVEMQLRLERALKRVADCPLLDGRRITGVVLAGSAATDIEHGLGREYLGFIAIRNSTGATLDESYVSDNRAKVIRLTASISTTVDLWVF